MADDMDMDMEMAKAKARARKRQQAQAEKRAPPTIRQGIEEDAFSPDSTEGAALRGLGQGASLGFQDELAGTVEGGAAAGAGALFGLAKTGPGRALVRKAYGLPDELPDAAVDAMIDAGANEGAQRMFGASTMDRAGYAHGRDAARQENDRASEVNPWTYGGAELAGAMLVPLPGPGKAKPLQTVGSRMLQTGKFGALAGGLAGAGHSRGETALDVAQDTAGSAAFGGALGAGGTMASVLAKRATQRPLQEFAEKMAVRAITPRPGLVNRLFSTLGLRTQDDINAFGRKILDENLLPVGGTPASTLERAKAATMGEGGRIGDVLAKGDSMVASGAAAAPSRQMQRIAVRRALRLASDTPARKAEQPAILKHLLDRVGEDPATYNAEQPATFRELWNNKSQLQRALVPGTVSDLGDELYREGVSGYTRGVYNQLENAVGPDDAATVRDAARRFGVARDVEKLLEQEVTRGAARSPVGLMDTQLGQVAGTTGIPGAGPIVTAGSAFLRSRAPAALARGANALSKVRPSAVEQYVAPVQRSFLDYQGKKKELDEEDKASIQAFVDGG